VTVPEGFVHICHYDNWDLYLDSDGETFVWYDNKIRHMHQTEHQQSFDYVSDVLKRII